MRYFTYKRKNNKANKFFIAGTDTGVGKTYVACGLLNACRNKQYSTVALKPIAAGGYEDVGKLQEAAINKLPYHIANPISLQLPCAPHIAAEKENKSLTLTNLLSLSCEGIFYPAEVCVIEGIGGWFVPINDYETMAD